MDPTLAAYVEEPVTIRYDPRDLGEVRVFHRNRFLCRAISPEYAGQAITLKDIQTARATHRRVLRGQINERIMPTAEFLPRTDPAPTPMPAGIPKRSERKTPKLRVYLEDP